jgi:hypothetical protein
MRAYPLKLDPQNRRRILQIRSETGQRVLDCPAGSIGGGLIAMTGDSSLFS